MNTERQKKSRIDKEAERDRQTHTHTHRHTDKDKERYIYIYVYICIYTFIYIYVYIYIYILLDDRITVMNNIYDIIHLYMFNYHTEKNIQRRAWRNTHKTRDKTSLVVASWQCCSGC